MTGSAATSICPACNGSGALESCRAGHSGNCPCAADVVRCEACNGEGTRPRLCPNCEEAPVPRAGMWCLECHQAAYCHGCGHPLPEAPPYVCPRCEADPTHFHA